jgi:hypothetical protein
VNVNFPNAYNQPLLLISSTTSPGWICTPSPSFGFGCYTLSMANGAAADLTLTVQAPTSNRGGAPFNLRAFVTSGIHDPAPTNNLDTASIGLTNSTRNAELSIAVEAPENPVGEATAISIPFAVRNNGTDPVNAAIVTFRTDLLSAALPQPFSISGSGWTCTNVSALQSVCRRDSLAAGASAPITMQFTTPSLPAQLYLQADVGADQPHYDAIPTNNQTYATLFVGDAENYSRILLPITDTDIPGANGSLWKSDLSMVIDSTEVSEIAPAGCGPIEDPCAPPPIGATFDPRDEDFLVGTSAQFIYVDREHASDVHASTRVYDATKTQETAGAFVPTARDADFSSTGFTLVGIPSGTQQRITLRIYDRDARKNANVQIEVYGDAGVVPIASVTRALSQPVDDIRLTTALLPAAPASAQLDLSALVTAGTYEKLRVKVRPVESGLKIWGFASITNNTTSHVTVVEP